MATIRMLADPWYHGFINDIVDRFPDKASPDARTNAIAMLNSAAMISSAIDSAFGHTAIEGSGPKSIVEAIDDMSSNFGDMAQTIADAMSSKNTEE